MNEQKQVQDPSLPTTNDLMLELGRLTVDIIRGNKAIGILNQRNANLSQMVEESKLLKSNLKAAQDTVEKYVKNNGELAEEVTKLRKEKQELEKKLHKLSKKK